MAAQFLGVWGIASGYDFKSGNLPYIFGKDSPLKQSECDNMVKNVNTIFAGINLNGLCSSKNRGEAALRIYNAIVDTKGWEFFVKTDKQQPGKMQVISDSFRNANSTTVKVDGNSVAITKEFDNIISFNTGATRENLKKPQTIVVNSNGKVFTTYYPFGDVPPGQPYTNAILQLWKANIVEGQNGMFDVNRVINRAEFLKMALLATKRGTDFPPTATTGFIDVDQTEWTPLSGFIYYAQANNIASGQKSPDGKFKWFKPGDSITRAETAKMIIKAVNEDKVFTWQLPLSSCQFNDLNSPLESYYSFVTRACQLKIMKRYDDGTFKPGNPLSRGEVALVACRAYSLKTQGNLKLCE